ncbi:hypothetical protein H0X10_04075 [Candidatus Saccharibacteria bacterium]|nr:hypothetical protein [Candidatus Saccharibacteria bacterium]
MYSNKFKKTSNQKTLLIIVGVVLALLVLLIVLEKTKVINLYSKKQPTSTEAKTTSTAPTAQADFSDGDERLIADTSRNEGIIKDTGGNLTDIPAESQWQKSSDGKITVYTPGKDSVVKNGDTLSGSSSLSQVSFRLIDDVTGVIAQGTLSVVNGNFSGSFDFSTTGTNGRLDIFNSSPDGIESSNTEIPVRFK